MRLIVTESYTMWVGVRGGSVGVALISISVLRSTILSTCNSSGQY